VTWRDLSSGADVPSLRFSGKRRDAPENTARLPHATTVHPLDLPPIVLELLEDLTPPAESGFLRLVRRRYRARYPDGSESEPFVYDSIDRRCLDAVVIAAHYQDDRGVRHVYLRSALRPPLLDRGPARSPTPDQDPPDAGIWELPAGLVEVSEQSLEGLRRTTARELREELGFDVPPERCLPLGPGTFPVAGLFAERHYYYEVSVDPSTRAEPSLDGSALEKCGEVVAVPLARTLELCRTGVLLDSKSELALRRLSERYPGGGAP
jgi:ADP-ribose pyrophosphatase